MLPARLETARLLLRPVVPDDASALFHAYAGDRFATWREHGSTADTEGFLATCIARKDARTYAIVLRETARPIGVPDLRHVASTRIDLGCALGRDHWNQGLMTEAVRATADWTLAHPLLWRFGAVVDTENHASARMTEKAGLLREGVLRRLLVHPNLGPAPRDCCSYALTRAGRPG